MKKVISELQEQLQKNADTKVKKWFENYLKGAIQYYGVKTPQVKKIVQSWREQNNLASFSVSEQLELCKKIISLNYAEEKFAATLYIQKYLIQKLTTEELLNTCEEFFTKGYFYDWSTADWFTVRVLDSIIKKDQNSLTRITSWASSQNLWQRRASVVALRTVAKKKQYIPLIIKTIDKLAPDPQRFIQTGIGWTLSDLSKNYPKEAEQVLEKNFAYLAQEVIDRHTKYLPLHQEYKKRKRKK